MNSIVLTLAGGLKTDVPGRARMSQGASRMIFFGK